MNPWFAHVYRSGIFERLEKEGLSIPPAWVKINVMAKKIFVSTDLCRCSGTDAQFAQLHGSYVIFHYEMAVLKRTKA